MTTLVIEPSTNDIQIFVNEGIPGNVTADSTVTFSNKTIPYASNTLTGVQPTLISGTNIKSINGSSILGSGDLTVLSSNLGGVALTNAKSVSFITPPVIPNTSGAITIDWSTSQNQVQTMPVGGITYTFSPPPGPCKLQLQVLNNGSGNAQAFVWPASVKWLLFVWEGVNTKGAIINFWYDGTNYWAMGSNQA